METIFMTGGTGFIGAKVLERLRTCQGARVYALTRKKKTDIGNVKYVEGDMSDGEALQRLMEEYRPTVLCHLAWDLNGESRDNVAQEKQWALWSTELVKLFLRAGGKHIISSGTCFEYDVFQNKLLGESMPLCPHSAYGEAKAELCQETQKLCNQYEARFVWGRIFYVYGAGEARGKLLTSVKNALLQGKRFVSNTPEFIVDYIHVDDVAEILARCIFDHSIRGILNICSGKGVKIRDLVLMMARLLDKEDSVDFARNPEQMHIVGDNSRLRSMGYQYKYELSSGLAAYLTGAYCEKD